MSGRKRRIVFLTFLFMGIFLYADIEKDIEKIVPNFLIKADVAGVIPGADKSIDKDMFGKLTFALDPFFILNDEKVKKIDFRSTPQLKMDFSYDFDNQTKLGLHYHQAVFETGVFYNIISNEFTFDFKIKPEWDFYFSDMLGLNVAPFYFYESNFSSMKKGKYGFGLELGFVFNPTRKYRNNIIRGLAQEKLEKLELEQQQEEKRKESLRLARRIICKKYSFESERDYLDWLNRTSSSNLINSLTAGNAYKNTFVIGDIIYMQPYMFSIGYMDYYGMDSFVYLVSLQGIGKYCKIISSHQIEYFDYTGGLISEPLVLKFVGRGTYRQGYSIQECDTFEVVEKGTADYDAHVKKLNDMAEIEKNPHLYTDILGGDYDAE